MKYGYIKSIQDRSTPQVGRNAEGELVVRSQRSAIPVLAASPVLSDMRDSDSRVGHIIAGKTLLANEHGIAIDGSPNACLDFVPT